MNFNKILIFIFISCAFGLNAQSFDLEQTAQLIRPRVKVDSKYNFDSKFSDTSHTFSSFENSAIITFPIKRKFKTDLSLNLNSLKIKDVIRNSLNIKAYEILGTFKVAQWQNTFGFDSVPMKNLYSAYAGIIGLHLTKKFRIVFYTANIGIQEQDKTLDKTVPRFSGVIGQYHIRGLRKSFYYGASLIYSDGLLIPAPFFGGTQPISKNLLLIYTFPVQINLQYHDDKSFTIMGVKADGYRSGILMAAKRTNVNVSNISAYLNFRYRFTKIFQIQVEGGYNFYQKVRFDKTGEYPYSYPTKGSPYVNAILNVFLGKSLLEKIVEQVF